MISKEGDGKMSPEGERPMVENELKQVEGTSIEQVIEKPIPSVEVPLTTVAAPITAAEFNVQLEKLSARAREAGLRPFQIMLSAYAKQGMAMLDGLLTSLDESSNTTPKKEK